MNEDINEIKNIPTGKEFSNLLTVYKAVSIDPLNYKYGYDRKQSAGWNGGGKDSYGEVAYTWLHLSDAIHATGSFGHNIVMFKLLGGLDGYVFFEYDRNSEIRSMLVKTYGSALNLHDQILKISGNRQAADKYGYYTDPSSFGRHALSELRRDGVFIRGFICTYWHGDEIVVYPCNFSDLVPCAAARNIDRYMGEGEVRGKFEGFLGDNEREVQSGFIDIVPHLQMVHAFDPDGAQYIRVGDKIYAPYESKEGPNILIIDDENLVKPNDVKLFPASVRLNEMPTNISRKGRFSFIMGGFRWIGNVLGQDENGQQLSPDGSPIFKLNGTEQWFEWQYLQWMFENPEYVKNELSNPKYEVVAESKKIISEAFKAGMSYDDFVQNNKAFVYVATHCYFLDGILNHGFSREYANANDFAQNGGSLTYGDGVYGTPSLENAANNLSMKTASKYEKPDGYKYGNIILKCSLLGGWRGFLIFDEEWARKIYKDKWNIYDQVDAVIKNDSARQELKNFISRFSGRELYNPRNDSMRRTNHVIFNMFSNKDGFEKWTAFFRKNGVRGAIYHGHGDGFCCVCYDYSEVVPIAISYDHGRTWTTDGGKWTLDNGKTYKTDGINWDATHDRLLYAADPANKFGAKYKTVSAFPKKICANDTIFGVVNVEKHNGRWNTVRTDNSKELFPIDFDAEPTLGMRGSVRFKYKGYDFKGDVSNEYTGLPSFDYDGNPYDMKDIDSVIYYYIEGNATQETEQEPEEPEYEVQDNVNDETLKESFFRFLDKMELL